VGEKLSFGKCSFSKKAGIFSQERVVFNHSIRVIQQEIIKNVCFAPAESKILFEVTDRPIKRLVPLRFKTREREIPSSISKGCFSHSLLPRSERSFSPGRNEEDNTL
jgi:hypothetical protein